MSRATVPGPDSSRRSISGCRRNWLTAPSRLIGSGADTATGTRRSTTPAAAPEPRFDVVVVMDVVVFRGELSIRFPLFTCPQFGTGR